MGGAVEGVRGRGLGAGAVQLAVTEPPAWGESPCEDGNVMGVGGSREPREMGRREQQSGWRSRQRKTGRTGQGAWDGGETTGLWWGARRGGPPQGRPAEPALPQSEVRRSEASRARGSCRLWGCSTPRRPSSLLCFHSRFPLSLVPPSGPGTVLLPLPLPPKLSACF